MNPLKRIFVAVLSLLLFTLSACGTNFQVVRQATPNPLINAHAFAIAPIRFDGAVARGQPLEVYLHSLDPNDYGDFVSMQNVMPAVFTQRMAVRGPWQVVAVNSPPPPGTFVIQ